jgi:hypothetical protein
VRSTAFRPTGDLSRPGLRKGPDGCQTLWDAPVELIDNGEQTVLVLWRAVLGLLAGSGIFDGLLSRLDEEGAW